MIENQPMIKRITLYDLILMILAFISPHRTSSASRDIELAELKNELVELRRLLTQVQADLAAARKNQDEEV
jgi:hypothetical protein